MYIEDTAAYLDETKREMILHELFSNAFRTIKNVYIFKHFDEYEKQLHALTNDEKKEVYWNASYYEKLIDYIKIGIAFETYNKAFLLKSGFLVHKIKNSSLTKDFFKIQGSGIPIRYREFLNHVGTLKNNDKKGSIYLNGLNDYFQTIKYSETLNDFYQEIIGLDKDLIFQLKKMNEKRNRLHFFTDYKGAFEVSRHIANWKFIMTKSIETIEGPLKDNDKK